MSDNIRELADTSYKSESYDEAYDYYSRLLEENPDDGEAWARKGVAAAWKSSLNDGSFKELKICLEKAEEKGYDIRNEDIGDRVLGATKEYIDDVYSFFDEKIEEKKKESMGTGTLKSVRDFNVQTYGQKRGREDLAPEWVKVAQVMEYACDLSPSVERCKDSIREIDKIFAHSNEWMEYLETEEAGETDEDLKSIRKNILEMAKDIDPSFKPANVKTGGGSSSTGGCYVATATVGKERHHILSTLRRLRDQHLLTNSAGQAFVAAYYTVGPYVAKVIERSELLRGLSMRLVIKPLYRLASRLVSDPK